MFTGSGTIILVAAIVIWLYLVFRKKKKPLPPKKSKPLPKPAMIPDDVARIVLGGKSRGMAQIVIRGGPPSDTGEADVDVACRWVEDNVPEARQIVDVEYMGESEAGSLYRVTYEVDAPVSPVAAPSAVKARSEPPASPPDASAASKPIPPPLTRRSEDWIATLPRWEGQQAALLHKRFGPDITDEL